MYHNIRTYLHVYVWCYIVFVPNSSKLLWQKTFVILFQNKYFVIKLSWRTPSVIHPCLMWLNIREKIFVIPFRVTKITKVSYLELYSVKRHFHFICLVNSLLSGYVHSIWEKDIRVNITNWTANRIIWNLYYWPYPSS